MNIPPSDADRSSAAPRDTACVAQEHREASDRPMPMAMPAPPEQAARDIANIGVEGRPADASSGPGLLRLEMLGMLTALVLLSVGFGAWIGWGVGLTMMVVGILALIFNPVMGAAAMRTADRKRAADFEKARLGGSRPRPQ